MPCDAAAAARRLSHVIIAISRGIRWVAVPSTPLSFVVRLWLSLLVGLWLSLLFETAEIDERYFECLFGQMCLSSAISRHCNRNH